MPTESGHSIDVLGSCRTPSLLSLSAEFDGFAGNHLSGRKGRSVPVGRNAWKPAPHRSLKYRQRLP